MNKKNETRIRRDHSIICNNRYGPIFGEGKDLVIFDNSNIVKSSYSNIGHSYSNRIFPYVSDHSQLFIAGSKTFHTTEIEVYTKAT